MVLEGLSVLRKSTAQRKGVAKRPMTRTDHLLWILAEECNEVAQRVSKAARFGLQEIQPGQPFDNASRILIELWDLHAAVEMLISDGSLGDAIDRNAVNEKKRKIEKFLKYSKECGTLE